MGDPRRPPSPRYLPYASPSTGRRNGKPWAFRLAIGSLLLIASPFLAAALGAPFPVFAMVLLVTWPLGVPGAVVALVRAAREHRATKSGAEAPHARAALILSVALITLLAVLIVAAVLSRPRGHF